MLAILLNSLKAVGFWFLFAFFGANLLGMIVRGFFVTVPVTDSKDPRIQDMYTTENRRLVRGNLVVTVASLAVAVGYFYGLTHYWNVILAMAAAMPMCARLPDLLWEIRTGRKVGVREGDGPKGPVYHAIYGLCFFGALPLTWYALWKR